MPSEEYELSIQIDPPQGGSVTITPKQEDSTYIEGQKVTLEGIPNERWRFFEWQFLPFVPGEYDTTKTIEIQMNQSHTVKAIFHQDVSFSSLNHIADLNDAIDVTAGDFNNDGNVDVAAVSNSGKIAWYDNQGDFNFSNERVLSNGVSNGNQSDDFRIEAADLNNDGLVDLISSANNKGVYWFESTGSGFTMHTLCCQNGYDIDVADLTGDSLPDILVSTQADSLIYYQNQGNGNFSVPVLIDDGIGNAISSSVADLNGDGNLDVISGELYLEGNPEEETRVAWYENKGDGSFGPEQIIDSNTSHYSVVKSADLNNDGLPEVISFITSSGEFYYYENMNNGNFSERKILAPNNPLELADIDSDGEFEVVMATPGSLLYYQLGEDYEIDRTREFLIDELNGIYGVDADIPIKDLDGDGDLDILFPSKEQNAIWWYENVSYED